MNRQLKSGLNLTVGTVKPFEYIIIDILLIILPIKSSSNLPEFSFFYVIICKKICYFFNEFIDIIFIC